jgi:hypothetical protein
MNARMTFFAQMTTTPGPHVSRRQLLTFGAAIALVLAAPPYRNAHTQLLSGGQVALGSTDFLGNPNFFATTIDTSGGIYNSRLTGDSARSPPTTPAFVHVSAKNIMATGAFKDTAGNTLSQFTVRPWEDLEFRWDFGDPGSTETFTRPTDGATVNSNIQAGPDAVHCYRTAGTKTITLTVRARNSDGSGFITAQVQQNLTVNSYATLRKPIHHFDSSYRGGDSNGTINKPWNTYAKLRELMVAAGNRDGVDIRLKRGSVFATTNDPTWQVGSDSFAQNIRLSAYGSGAQPVIRKTFTSGNRGPIWNWAGRNNVISNVDFELHHNGFGIAEGALLSHAALGASSTKVWDHYYDGVNFKTYNAIYPSSFFYLAGQSGPAAFGNETCPHEGNVTNWGLWNCSGAVSGSGNCSTNQVFVGVGRFWFIYGGGWGGGSMRSPDWEHQVYPNVWRHSLYKWMNFTDTGPGKGFALNINWDVNIGNDLTCQYLLVSECNFPGTACNHAHDAGSGSGTGRVQYYNAVFEKNAYHGFGVNRAIFGLGPKSYTWRDNRAWDNGSTVFMAERDFEDMVSYCYRNRIHVRSTAQFPGGPIEYRIQSAVPFIHTDNIIVNEASIPGRGFFNMNWTAMATKKPLIDRNQYYPNTSVARTFGDGSNKGNRLSKSFSNLQAAGYERNSQNDVNPGWPSPVTRWADMGPSPN